jgi:hypothetical protein
MTFQPSHQSTSGYGDAVEGSDSSTTVNPPSVDYTEYLKYAQMGIPLVAGLLSSQTTKERVEELKAKIKNWKLMRDNAKWSITRGICSTQINKLEGELAAAQAELAEEERTAWTGDAARYLGVGAGLVGLFLVVQYGRRMTR